MVIYIGPIFNAGVMLVEEMLCNLTHSREDRGLRTFPLGISPKLNVIERLKFKLVYNDSAVLHVNHYATETKKILS